MTIIYPCRTCEEGLAALEATGGDANRAFNTTSGSHGNGQEDCKFGDDCFAIACKWRHSKDHDPAAAWGREQEKRRTNEKSGKGGKGGNSSKRGKGDTGKQRCKQQGCQEHQKQEYCNAHYRKFQEKSSAKLSRKEKRAAKADSKSENKRAAKASKADKLQALPKQARGQGKQSERKRNRVQAAIIDSDDDKTVSVFDRITSKGAPKCVKATHRQNKQDNAQSVADLLDTDSDSSE
jgi:hypothetical protein